MGCLGLIENEFSSTQSGLVATMWFYGCQPFFVIEQVVFWKKGGTFLIFIRFVTHQCFSFWNMLTLTCAPSASSIIGIRIRRFSHSREKSESSSWYSAGDNPASAVLMKTIRRIWSARLQADSYTGTGEILVSQIYNWEAKGVAVRSNISNFIPDPFSLQNRMKFHHG